MAKFRKKPVVIEAEQYSKKRQIEEGYLPRGVRCLYVTDEDGSPHEVSPIIETLAGNMGVSDGDWIITGVKGERYPVRADIFQATYEPVGEGTATARPAE
ncbi:hypothetical protein LCGC14_1430430 [marine sediment metagenome]|uniref:Uncharacterized protein n=1 Tax=marine sediment metagenome TaxID=412755 RepID=A0A0F9M498_9ZZZZ